MNLRQALVFPIQSPARVLVIVLTQTVLWFTLPVISHYLYRFREQGSFALYINILIFIVFLLDVIWLHGYSVAVIRSIFAGLDAPPAVDLRTNMREGGWLLVATLVYGTPIFLLFGAAVHTINQINFSYPTGSYNYQAVSTVFITILVGHFALKFLARITYDIGVARYASNEYRESVFEISTNFSILKKNKRTAVLHEFRQALLLALYALLAYVAIQIGNAIIPTPTGDILDDPIAFNWTVVAVLVFALGYLLYLMSSLHLFAQYAIKIGITREPRKHKNDLV